MIDKRKTFFIAMVMISLIGIAAAWANLGISPDTQSIYVGTYGYYTLTLDSSDSGSALNWATDSPTIVASIKDSSSASYPADVQVGTLPISYTGGSGPHTYDLRVMPISGAVVPSTHDISVGFLTQQGWTKAVVTGSGNIVPELPTSTLLTVGLIGLIGIVKLRRKDD